MFCRGVYLPPRWSAGGFIADSSSCFCGGRLSRDYCCISRVIICICIIVILLLECGARALAGNDRYMPQWKLDYNQLYNVVTITATLYFLIKTTVASASAAIAFPIIPTPTTHVAIAAAQLLRLRWVVCSKG